MTLEGGITPRILIGARKMHRNPSHVIFSGAPDPRRRNEQGH